jgi:hypothetical protein
MGTSWEWKIEKRSERKDEMAGMAEKGILLLLCGLCFFGAPPREWL